MTVAVDIKTGRVIGQVVDDPHRFPCDPVGLVRLFSKDGIRYVPAASVRLEKVS